jgi:hypothetical protein
MSASMSLRQRFGYLPACLVHVLEATDEDTVLQLVARLGGTRVHVGREPRPGDGLVAAVGLTAAQAIQARMAAEHYLQFDVPTMARTLELRRRARICELRADGMTVAQVARSVGLTERAVYYALAAQKVA